MRRNAMGQLQAELRERELEIREKDWLVVKGEAYVDCWYDLHGDGKPL